MNFITSDKLLVFLMLLNCFFPEYEVLSFFSSRGLGEILFFKGLGVLDYGTRVVGVYRNSVKCFLFGVLEQGLSKTTA